MKTLPALCLFLLLSSRLPASFLSESTGGDLSNNWISPSTLTLEPGSNYVSGTTNLGDPDLFTINVPSGLQVIELHLANYEFFIQGNRTFIGYQDGATLLQDPLLFTADSSGDISFHLFGHTDIGREILGEFTISPNATSTPLGEGSYAFWINEVEPQPASYAFEFVTDFAPTPEPRISLMLTALGILFLRRSRTGVASPV